MREKDLIFVLQHTEGNEPYTRELNAILQHTKNLVNHLNREHILDAGYKMNELHRHLDEVMLLTCEICSGVSRSEYKGGESLTDFLKSTSKLEKMWQNVSARPDKTTNDQESFENRFFSIALEYLQVANQKVKPVHLSRYIASNMYNINIDSEKPVMSTLRNVIGKDEAKTFLKHTKTLYSMMHKYEHTDRLIKAIKMRIGGDDDEV